jgi:hypothetical protein
VIQYGFITLFVTSFPLAPLLALLNNYLEIRVDAYKLAKEMRRPLPRGAEDIGTWYTILDIMAQVSVITNALVAIFTGKRFTYGMTTAQVCVCVRVCVCACVCHETHRTPSLHTRSKDGAHDAHGCLDGSSPPLRGNATP